MPLLCSLLQLGWYAIAWSLHIRSIPLVAVWTLVGVILYAGAIFMLERQKTESLLKLFIPRYGRS